MGNEGRRRDRRLIGASRPEQILENLKALEGAPLSAEELKKIDELVQPLLA